MRGSGVLVGIASHTSLTSDRIHYTSNDSYLANLTLRLADQSVDLTITINPLIQSASPSIKRTKSQRCQCIGAENSLSLLIDEPIYRLIYRSHESSIVKSHFINRLAYPSVNLLRM